MAAENAVHCAEQDVELSMAGTADRVDVWLLLEYRGTWTPRVLTEAPFAEPVRVWLDTTVAAFAAEGLRLRPQLIRQPDARRDSLRLFLSGQDRSVGIDLDSYAELAAVDGAALWREGSNIAPNYFVCTNGQRDVCCARLGRPLYARLRELVGARAWQVTHLGGHRYAPNVLVTPANLLYGRVLPQSVDQFVSCVESGQIDFPLLRGRTAYTPAVQAAECLLARQNLTLLHVDGEDVEPGQPVTVEFAGACTRHRIRVARQAQPQMVLASCRDDARKPFHPFASLASEA